MAAAPRFGPETLHLHALLAIVALRSTEMASRHSRTCRKNRRHFRATSSRVFDGVYLWSRKAPMRDELSLAYISTHFMNTFCYTPFVATAGIVPNEQESYLHVFGCKIILCAASAHE